MKMALTSTPVIQLSYFSSPFIVECDASGTGFGDVLHQGAGAIAFFSRPIAASHTKLAAYERELIGLVKAVRHWRPYLWGRAFTVRTDHYSLKYLLDQRLSTIPQHTWVSKLFGYDFAVEFRPGRQNAVADAMSRHHEVSATISPVSTATLLAISSPTFAFFDDLRTEMSSNASFQSLCEQVLAGTAKPAWS